MWFALRFGARKDHVERGAMRIEVVGPFRHAVQIARFADLADAQLAALLANPRFMHPPV
jgi:hypothetical protein